MVSVRAARAVKALWAPGGCVGPLDGAGQWEEDVALDMALAPDGAHGALAMHQQLPVHGGDLRGGVL